MKLVANVFINLLGAYLLALPIMFYGIHEHEHPHHDTHEAHSHAEGTEMSAAYEDVDCTLCDLYQEFDSFSTIEVATLFSNYATCRKFENKVDALITAKLSLNLRGPPFA